MPLKPATITLFPHTRSGLTELWATWFCSPVWAQTFPILVGDLDVRHAIVPAVDPVLHGRAAPLAALRVALEGAIAGRGQLALVSGEAGIGKSAIARAIAREAEARGVIVTWGHAWEFADAPPYFPVWPCLRTLGIDAGQDGLEARDEGHAFHLWEDVVASLARASASTASLWIVEDLHAADVGTLDLLTFLARPLRAMRVLVVATLREKDPRLTDRMMQRLTRMARDGLAVALERLSEGDVAALTEETLGRAVPRDAVRRLAELTGGNPLFAVECARAFRSAGGIEGTLRSLPPTVRQVVLDRVALLPAATRHALVARGGRAPRGRPPSLRGPRGQSPPDHGTPRAFRRPARRRSRRAPECG